MRGPEKGPDGRNVAPANLIIDNLESRSCELSFSPTSDPNSFEDR
jgi:hypothetical protein